MSLLNHKVADFWIVWNPHSATPPRFRHASREAAEREAERLAAARPGQIFMVLEPRYSVTYGPQRVSYVAPISDDEVPF
jgi:hypothetical protein